MKTRWKIAQAAEIRWWKNYLKKKPVGEYLAWKKNYWEEMLQSLELAPKAGDRVLDAGCGPAGIFMALPNSEVTALDPLLDQYENDIPHFSKENYPGVHFLSMPLENFEEEEAYDFVFCLNAINHVSDLALSFDRIVRALRPGGQLIVSIDAHNHQILKKIFRLLPGDILHPHQYDQQEYLQMLRQRSCRIQNSILYKPAFIFNYYVVHAIKGTE